MAGGLGKLCGTIEPDGNYVWNDFGMIEGLIVYFELQIGDWLRSFDLKNIQI